MQLKEIESLYDSAWSRPDKSVLNPRREAPRLPLDIFRPFWSEWIRDQAEARSVPVDYVAASVLVAAATLIGNARWVSPWQSWTEPPVLWAALIGKPSSGKSPSLTPIRESLTHLEDELSEDFSERLRLWERDNEEASAIYDNWKLDVKTAAKKKVPPPDLPGKAKGPDRPVRPRLWISDATQESVAALLSQHFKGTLSYRDELAGWLESFNRYSSGGDRPFWIEAYGGRPYRVDRVKNPEPLYIPRLSISLMGGLQPDTLSEVLLAGRDDGLSARFLYFWPDRVKSRRPTATAATSAAFSPLRRLRSLEPDQDDHGNPTPRVLRLDNEAAGTFATWRTDHEDGEPDGKFSGWWGKMPGTVLRLALVLEMLWWCPDQTPEPQGVSGDAVFGAIGLIEGYLKPMAERVYADARLPSDERGAATLARWILKHKPDAINRRKLRREARLGVLKNASAMEAACDILEGAHWLSPCGTRKGESSGRLSTDYQVNPRLYEDSE